MPKENQYLGDGVYATNDGFHIILKTEALAGNANVIYLNDEVFCNLVMYAEKIGFYKTQN